MTEQAETMAAMAPPSSPWRVPRPSWPVVILAFLLVLAAVLLILAAWRLPPFGTTVQRTEDAYVEGRTTVIAPQVPGYVWRVHVDDFNSVDAGQLLAEIDPRPYDRKVEEARAALAARIADLDNNRQSIDQATVDVRVQSAEIVSADAKRSKADLDARRSGDLIRDGSLSERENDADVAALREADAALRQARATRDRAVVGVRSAEVERETLAANVEQARATLHSAELDRAYADIRAPQDGTLSEVGVRLGQFVSAGTPLMFMVPGERWVIAYYKERQVRLMRPGQQAWFAVDALGGAVVHGHVERMAPAAASEFSALKPENGTGNFTKVPQRIPVRISVDPGRAIAAHITPGMSVEAHVDTSR